MRHLITVTLLVSFVFSVAALASAQNPTPTLTSTSQASSLDEPTVKLVDVLVSAVVALVIAAGGWLVQRHQFHQTFLQKEKELAQQQSQFLDKMELEWTRFRQQFTPPERQVLVWLDSLDMAGGEDIISDSPYVVGQPIHDPSRFYGRQELVAHLYKAMFAPEANSKSVLGAHRTGITSLLFYISHPDVLHTYAKMHMCPILPVYINLQAQIVNPQRFYSYILRATARTLERQGAAHFDAPDFPVEIDYSFVTEFFDKACHYGYRFMLLLDEFEELIEGNFDESFFGSLRALATGRNRDVAFVTTSFRDPFLLLDGKFGPTLASPFFNIFDPALLYLGALSEEEARQLITRPAEKAGHPFTDEDVTFILKLAGRLPFAIQAAASMLYNKTGISAQDRVCEDFNRAMKKHFDHYWAHFTSTERQALLKLVRAGELTSDDYEALSGLADYGFVEEIHGDYRILGDAFTEWITMA